MSDTFIDACMWYKDSYLNSDEDMTEHEMFIAKYFWDSAVYALENKLEQIVDDVKLMKGTI